MPYTKHKKYKVTPEGREGVYILDAKTALLMVKRCPKQIHCLVEAGILIGSDWERASVEDAIKKANKIGLLMPPNTHMGHQLVCINSNQAQRFDVGEITPDMIYE